MTQISTLIIAANLDVAAAVARHDQLVSACEAGNFRIEIDGLRPTALALQLAIATRKTLESDDRFQGFGPNAAQIFDHISI